MATKTLGVRIFIGEIILILVAISVGFPATIATVPLSLAFCSLASLCALALMGREMFSRELRPDIFTTIVFLVHAVIVLSLAWGIPSALRLIFKVSAT